MYKPWSVFPGKWRNGWWQKFNWYLCTKQNVYCTNIAIIESQQMQVSYFFIVVDLLSDTGLNSFGFDFQRDQTTLTFSAFYHTIIFWWAFWYIKRLHVSWLRHQMETFSALLAFCAGNSPVTGEFPVQRPVTQSFDVFLYLPPNQQLSKRWGRRWFETPSRSLWRHGNTKRFV